MSGPLTALRSIATRLRRGDAVRIDARVLARTAPRRWPALAAMAVGVLAVVAVVLVSQHGRQPWSAVGTPQIVATVPDDAAIGLFALRLDHGRMALAVLARGRGQRCFSIQFSIDGQPGRSAPILGTDCRPRVIAGRGLSVDAGQSVRVYASGKLLEDVHAADLADCGTGRNLCALAFDRHAERISLESRKRKAGETDRDDQLLSVLQTGGRATESPQAKRPTPRDVRFGEVDAQLWSVSLEVTGKVEPTTAQAIGALMTRRPAGFSVLVNDDRIPGSTRSLVVGGDGAFVPD